MTNRRSFFGSLAGAVAGLFGVKAAAAKPEYTQAQFLHDVFRSKSFAADFATVRLVEPEPMTVERAITVLNWAKHRDLEWSHDCGASTPSGHTYIAGRYSRDDERCGPYTSWIYEEFVAICVAEKLEREHLLVVRESAKHKVI